MDLLITLIGNAAVDPSFREAFLHDPEETVERYGFHLTKGEFEMMQKVFVDLTKKEREELTEAFLALEDKLYLKTGCGKPCAWSIFPPPRPTKFPVDLAEPEKAGKPKKRAA